MTNPPAKTPATILIVDDVAANRCLLRELLDTGEYLLIEAPDGATALQIANRTPPDLVLLDAVMPGMDGFEVCRRLRADPRLAEVPIVMLTALDDEASRLAGLNMGADDFIAKPFNSSELRARVRTITRLNRYRRITEMQEQLMRAQRLNNLGMLAAGIAHDFNNALAPILLAGHVLRPLVSTPAGQHMLDIVEKSSERGAALVRQMLSFARGMSGERRLVQVGDVLREVIDLAGTTFKKSMTIESNVSPDLWPIMGDPTQINQVFMNLFINARDAVGQAGEITVTAKNCTLDAAAVSVSSVAHAGKFVMIEVRDNGTGMSPGVLERIWEPFFTTKGDGKGTGLGLSTVRGIVRQHDGFISVRTTPLGPNHGTVFTVYLAAAVIEKKADGGADVPAVNALRGGGELILVVDDEESVREVCASTLIKQGYKVATAKDGAEAIAAFALRSNDVRLLLTDLDMPVVGGTTLIATLRRLSPGLPVVVMSGSDRQNVEAHDLTGAAHLTKPFAAESLTLVVRHALDEVRQPVACMAAT